MCIQPALDQFMGVHKPDCGLADALDFEDRSFSKLFIYEQSIYQ